MGRQRQRENRPTLGTVGGFDAPTQKMGQLTRQGQPQTNVPLLLLSRRIGTEKRLEDERQGFGINART